MSIPSNKKLITWALLAPLIYIALTVAFIFIVKISKLNNLDNIEIILIGSFLTKAVAVITILICMGVKPKNWLKHVGYLKPKIYHPTLGLSVGIASIILTVIILSIVAANADIGDTHNSTTEMILKGNTLLMFLSVAVFAPILEETFFRGVIGGNFIKAGKPIWGGLISSIIFMFVHIQDFNALYDYVALFNIFLLGSFLYMLYYFTKNIWASIIAHSTYNTIIFTLGYIAASLTKS